MNRRLLPQRIVTLYDAHRFVSRVLNASDVVSDELLDEDEAAAEEQERPRDGVLWMVARSCINHFANSETNRKTQIRKWS